MEEGLDKAGDWLRSCSLMALPALLRNILCSLTTTVTFFILLSAEPRACCTRF